MARGSTGSRVAAKRAPVRLWRQVLDPRRSWAGRYCICAYIHIRTRCRHGVMSCRCMRHVYAIAHDPYIHARMADIIHMSFHIDEWVMSHIMNTSLHNACEWLIQFTCNSHMCMSHVFICELCVWDRCLWWAIEYMCHVSLRHVSLRHLRGLEGTVYIWVVVSYICMSCVAYMYESCHIYTHMNANVPVCWMSHGTYMTGSCHTHEW